MFGYIKKEKVQEILRKEILRTLDISQYYGVKRDDKTADPEMHEMYEEMFRKNLGRHLEALRIEALIEKLK